MSLRTWTRDDVRQAVRETTAASGVPERITDPVLLDRLAVLLRPAVEMSRSAPTRTPSRAPAGRDISGAGSSLIAGSPAGPRTNAHVPDTS